jgi:hypothetical protein
MKMKKTVTGKKSPTNPDRKEQHIVRKYKVVYLDQLRDQELKQELKEFINADREI